MNIFRFAGILMTTILIFACGCASPMYNASIDSLSDEEIASEVQNRLDDDDVTGRYTFGVTVEDGVVTLQGSVPTKDTLRARIVSTAASAPGVVSVEEDLYPPMIGPY